MRKLVLVSVFAVFMTVAVSHQSTVVLSVATPAYAGDDEHERRGHYDSDHSSVGEVAFSCPGGLTSCYRADGTEFIDVNALEATASGYNKDEDHADDDKDRNIQVVNPKHFRSF